MARTYTTDGRVRGNCGHRHRTIRAAVACMRRDQLACRTHGGYSDRSVRPTTGAMTDAELSELDDALCRAGA